MVTKQTQNITDIPKDNSQKSDSDDMSDLNNVLGELQEETEPSKYLYENACTQQINQYPAKADNKRFENATQNMSDDEDQIFDTKCLRAKQDHRTEWQMSFPWD